MIDQRRRDHIDSLLRDGAESGVLAAISGFDAEELHYFISEYNWDDGFAVPTAVIEHDACDQATALQAFWLAEGVHAMELSGAPEYQEDWFSFARSLAQKILAGRYRLGPNEFDPQLSRVQQYKYRKQGIDEVFLIPVSPTED